MLLSYRYHYTIYKLYRQQKYDVFVMLYQNFDIEKRSNELNERLLVFYNISNDIACYQ